MDSTKTVFTTHIDKRGRLQQAKEIFECPHCKGEAFITNESVSPGGIPKLSYECSDCKKEWDETY